MAFIGGATAIFASAQTTVPSIISTSQTWNAAGSPYIVNQNTLIQQGVTVNVGPGTVIQTNVNTNRIIVDGELIAVGKKDSVITCDLITFQFTDKSTGYDAASGNGSQFHYVFFKGDGSSGGLKTLDLKETGLLVRNCKFIDNYYCIYSYNYKDTNDLIIEKSVFRGVKTAYGYPVYASSSFNQRLFFTDNYAEHMSGIFFGSWAEITNSTFRDFSSYPGIRQAGQYNHVKLECNLFSNFDFSVTELSYAKPGASLEMLYNTFDSSRSFFESYATTPPATFTARYNNFLNFSEHSVVMKGMGTPGIADTFDFQQNYWGSTNPSSIAAGIKDFNDDITIGVVVDFSNYLTSPVTSCSGGGTIGDADTGSSQGGSTGIMKMELNGFVMYPNPANSTITLSVENTLISTIRITDLSGKEILIQQPNDAKASVDLSHIINGAYVVEVECEGQVLRRKLIVSH